MHSQNWVSDGPCGGSMNMPVANWRTAASFLAAPSKSASPHQLQNKNKHCQVFMRFNVYIFQVENALFPAHARTTNHKILWFQPNKLKMIFPAIKHDHYFFLLPPYCLHWSLQINDGAYTAKTCIFGGFGVFFLNSRHYLENQTFVACKILCKVMESWIDKVIVTYLPVLTQESH